mmetsp:Transcript_13886/g.23702  ORF Transcript_13886/g.23702 Transcript_13886/m.23702 type:complete len:156 (-) Transcript_13886:46-513(-)
METANDIVARALLALLVLISFHANHANAFVHPFQPSATTSAASAPSSHPGNSRSNTNLSPQSLARSSSKHTFPALHRAKVDDADSEIADDAAATATTKVGSKEYYQGFVTRSVNEEPVDRVTGDAILGPTLKFAGGVSFILVALVGLFLASNGLI